MNAKPPQIMKPLTFETVLRTVKEYFLMTLGMMLYSFGWIGCIMPVKGTGGGAAGLSLVLCHALSQVGIDLQIGTMVFFLNAVLLLVAGFIIGWNFGVKTIFCVVVISLGMNFWQSVLPEGDFLHLERILAVILGGILAGIGIAMCFAQGGSTGGTDIVAMLLQKFAGIKFSTGILLADGSVVLSGLVVIGFGIGTAEAEPAGWMLTLYSLITIYITSRVIAYMLDGASYDKLLFIITDKHQELRQFILEDLERSATYLKGKGMYTEAMKDVIFLVVSRREVRQVEQKIRSIDPRAFVVVTDAYDTYGEGFKPLPDADTIQAE